MFYELKPAAEDIFGIQPIEEDDKQFQQAKEVVEADYDIGTVEAVFEMFGGFTNKSYGIYARKDGELHTWFFRKYMRNKQYTELMMEHTLLLHIRKNGFDKGAAPIYAKNGTTYAERTKKNENGENELLNTKILTDETNKTADSLITYDVSVFIQRSANAAE